jgi:hypothetical protein
MHIVNQLKLPAGFKKFITSNGDSREEITSVLSKVECQKGP